MINNDLNQQYSVIEWAKYNYQLYMPGHGISYISNSQKHKAKKAILGYTALDSVSQ